MRKRKIKPMTRSENMSRVRNKGTKPEIYFRKKLWHYGFRYRINYNELPGKPDIFLSKYRIAIFINGCFWHLHQDCKFATLPKTNREFWINKLNGNRERDLKIIQDLENDGIRVIVVWGCEIKNIMKDEKLESDYFNTFIEKIRQL